MILIMTMVLSVVLSVVLSMVLFEITVLVITLPVAVVVPLMITTIPCVILVPATLVHSVQLMPAVNGLLTVSAIPGDCVVESGLRPFRALLALCPIVRLRTRHRDKQQKHTQRCGSDQRFSESGVISPCVHRFPPVTNV